MKKTLITLITLVTAYGVFGQGAINYNNFISGTLKAPVFGVDPANPTAMKQGNTSAGIPAGTQTYGGALIGGTPGTGPQFTAQLFMGAPGATDDQLTPVAAAVQTFRTTSSGAGLFLAGITVGNLDTTANQRAQLRVWDNSTGVTSWSQLYPSGGLNGADAQFGNVARGWSLSFNVSPTAAPTAPAFLTGLQSFQLFTVVPEPSVIALGVLGVGALVLFRRRKN